MGRQKIMDCPDCGEELFTQADLTEHQVRPFNYSWIPDDSEPLARAVMHLAESILYLADKNRPPKVAPNNKIDVKD